MAGLEKRFLECRLEIHPEKRKIVYCGGRNQKETGEVDTSFVFLGYEFRTRITKDSRAGRMFSGFLSVITVQKLRKPSHRKLGGLNVRNKSNLSLQQIAE